MAVMGVAFLLFLAGLEVDLSRLRGAFLRLPLIGFAGSLALGLGVGGVLTGAGLVHAPLLIAITLRATSLGLIVPVLKDAGQSSSDFGQLVIAGGTLADFGAVILLTLFYSGESSGIGAKLLLLGTFVLLIAVVGLGVARAGRSMRVSDVLVRLQDTPPRSGSGARCCSLIGFTALASRFGLETILGAFMAGAILGAVDRDTVMNHPNFRLKLEGMGYGFFVPVFFVASGIAFNLEALFASASTVVLIPLFLMALLLVRRLPAVLYRSTAGARGAVAAGLLLATSLPFIVTATNIGVALGVLGQATAAALVAAGLLSVLIFPLAALTLPRGSAEPTLEGISGSGDN